MAQTNYTPISLYYSTTASAVPTAANLVPGELAINTADGKLYYEDSAGVVQVLATKSTGSIGGSNTQVQFNNSGSLGGSSGLTWDGSFLTTSSIKNSALTSGRVTYAGASGLLTDSANLQFTGSNLGIGVSNPTQLLQLGNATAVEFDMFVGATRTGTFYVDNSQMIITAPTAINMYFKTADTTRLTIGGNGNIFTASGTNVGIGTSSPSQPLTVNGVIASIGPATALSASSIFMDYNTTSNSGRFAAVGNTTGTAAPIYFSQYSSNASVGRDAVVIDASGNLGVGTTSPTSFGGFKSLELANSSGNAISLVTGTSVIAQTIASNTNSLVYTGTRSNHSLVITTNDAERMRIDTSGIVTMNAYGAGAATFSASGVISSVSDETWKIKDGVPTNTDAMLQKLEPGYWFYNEEKAPTFGQERQLGFYAQNVHEAIGEEAAPTPQEGKPWGYHDRSVLAIAVMSLKTALNTIEELKQRILILENK
jgi:hypothetical protein